MKRAFVGVILINAVALLAGCPMYSGSSNGCYGGTCGGTNDGGPPQCEISADCPTGYACQDGACVWQFEGADCSVTGCQLGQICELAGGIAQCVPVGGFSSGVDASSSPDGSTAIAMDAGSVVVTDASTPDGAMRDGAVVDSATSDAAVVDVSPPPLAMPCNADSTCGGSGARCVDGLCTPQSALCSDTSQCLAAGSACVDGVCIPRCSTASPTCPDGYACDFDRGVCDLGTTQPACTSSASCQGGSVCVEGRCVQPCGGDGGAACGASLLCVNGGCIPNQAAAFQCKNDGLSGSNANMCGNTQICLHHSCYDACDPDGGASCGAGMCKEVTVGAGTYAVCGSSSTLGSQCDLAAASPCASGVCIDGYCVP